MEPPENLLLPQPLPSPSRALWGLFPRRRSFPITFEAAWLDWGPHCLDDQRLLLLTSQRHRHRHGLSRAGSAACLPASAFSPGRAESPSAVSTKTRCAALATGLGGNGCCGSPHTSPAASWLLCNQNRQPASSSSQCRQSAPNVQRVVVLEAERRRSGMRLA